MKAPDGRRGWASIYPNTAEIIHTRLSGLLSSTEVHHQPRFEARELIATGKDPKEHREAELQLCAVPPMPFAYVLVFKKAVWLDQARPSRCYAAMLRAAVTRMSPESWHSLAAEYHSLQISTILRATVPHYVDIVAGFV